MDAEICECAAAVLHLDFGLLSQKCLTLHSPFIKQCNSSLDRVENCPTGISVIAGSSKEVIGGLATTEFIAMMVVMAAALVAFIIIATLFVLRMKNKNGKSELFKEVVMEIESEFTNLSHDNFSRSKFFKSNNSVLLYSFRC